MTQVGNTISYYFYPIYEQDPYTFYVKINGGFATDFQGLGLPETVWNGLVNMISIVNPGATTDFTYIYLPNACNTYTS